MDWMVSVLHSPRGPCLLILKMSLTCTHQASSPLGSKITLTILPSMHRSPQLEQCTILPYPVTINVTMIVETLIIWPRVQHARYEHHLLKCVYERLGQEVTCSENELSQLIHPNEWL
jgi:hypothetical protein